MTYARPSATERSMPRHHAASPLPQAYCPIPQSLITNLHDTPLAIGLYALVARLYLVHQSPIPLSRADVMRYDPTLKAGAVKRAFDRLVDGGWLMVASHEGHQKQRYTPTWGRVKGEPLAWRMEQPCLGRPRHIIRLGVDRSLLDICMGKLTPHATQAGTITRYVTTPALSLSDVGCYALTLADLPHETPGLRWLGVVRNGQALSLPSEERLLALISQRTLTLDDATSGCQPELTLSGTRRLGLHPLLPALDPQPSALFFVPPALIGCVIGSLIGSQIGQGKQSHGPTTAPRSAERRSNGRPEGITWEGSDQAKQGSPPLPPLANRHNYAGGGGAADGDQTKSSARAARTRKRPKGHETRTVPVNETTELLQTINVLPEQQLELAEVPIDVVKRAIADGQARSGVRDLAGWVVKLLRSHRDYGWQIKPPAPNPQSPEALRAAFAHYAAQQEVERRADLPDDHPWFPLEDPVLLNMPGALTRLWNDVQAALKTQLTRVEFNTWICHVRLLGIDRSVATVMAPNALVKEALEDRYLGALRDLLTMHVGETLEVRVILNPNAPEHSREPATPIASAAAAPPDMDARPSWVAGDRWATLPAMLRAALAGSTLIDGEVVGRVPYLSRLLATRYVREVGELVVVASQPSGVEGVIREELAEKEMGENQA